VPRELPRERILRGYQDLASNLACAQADVWGYAAKEHALRPPHVLLVRRPRNSLPLGTW